MARLPLSLMGASPVLMVLVVCVALLGSAHAVRVRVHNVSDCAEANVTASYIVPKGDCVEIEDFPAAVVCVSNAASSNWEIRKYTDAPCEHLDTTASGTDNEDCIQIGTLYYTVDCSVSGSSCFSGSSEVRLQDGSMIAYESLRVGDMVQSVDAQGQLFYDRVFRLTSWHPEDTGAFVRLETSAGTVLEVAASHFLHVNECCGLEAMTLAGDVQAGDRLFVVQQDQQQLAAEEVVSVRKVMAGGIFNAHTLQGNIVVNGVAASHFTTETKWDTTKQWAPYWYSLVDMVNRAMGW